MLLRFNLWNFIYFYICRKIWSLHLCRLAPCRVTSGHAFYLPREGLSSTWHVFSQTPWYTNVSSSSLQSFNRPCFVCDIFCAYLRACVESKSICLAACLAFVLYCIETVCVTQIMRVDLCGISQLLQFLTIKWDIPADPFIEAHSELQDTEFIISRPLTAVECHYLFFLSFVSVFVSSVLSFSCFNHHYVSYFCIYFINFSV